MKKGFIFSLDAALAAMLALSLVTVGLLIIAWGEANNFSEVQKYAADAAIVSSYTLEEPGEFSSEGINQAISNSSENGACFSYSGKNYCSETG